MAKKIRMATAAAALVPLALLAAACGSSGGGSSSGSSSSPSASASSTGVSLTETGRRRFEAAMPYWEEAQRRAGELFSLDKVRALARTVRRQARAGP